GPFVCLLKSAPFSHAIAFGTRRTNDRARAAHRMACFRAMRMDQDADLINVLDCRPNALELNRYSRTTVADPRNRTIDSLSRHRVSGRAGGHGRQYQEICHRM